MSVELLLLGQRCNLACVGCYEETMRDAGNEGGTYDLDTAVESAIQTCKATGSKSLTLFGGEPFLLPINDLEIVLERVTAAGLSVSAQTNGTIITPKHLELFKRYHVSIGLSLDGPDELNDWRVVRVKPENQHRQLELTRLQTSLIHKNVDRLLEAGIVPSIITTITAFNAGTDAKLDRYIEWANGLTTKGIRYLNLHLLEVHKREGEAEHLLNQERQITVFRRLRRELKGFTHVSPFDDMKSKLSGGSGNCIWNHCSPYSTPAVTGINGQGEAARCGRLNTDGVSWERSQQHSHERYLSLYLRPMQQGGCGGCRFFTVCGGECPGNAENHDWRERTMHCETIQALMQDTEQELFAEGKEPVSLSLKRPLLEWQLVSKWAGLATPETSCSVPDRPHGDAPHGDIAHGDHTDTAVWQGPPVSVMRKEK